MTRLREDEPRVSPSRRDPFSLPSASPPSGSPRGRTWSVCLQRFPVRPFAFSFVPCGRRLLRRLHIFPTCSVFLKCLLIVLFVPRSSFQHVSKCERDTYACYLFYISEIPLDKKPSFLLVTCPPSFTVRLFSFCDYVPRTSTLFRPLQCDIWEVQ